MRTTIKILGVCAAAAVAPACSTMSKNECLAADWQAIGYEDGAAGAPVSAISHRRRACGKKAGLAPDMDAYLAGRREGLEQYCTPSNGFTVGSRGSAYHGVCDGPTANRFLTAYQRGQHLHDLRTGVVVAGQAIDNAQRDLWNVKRRMAELEAAMVSPVTPLTDRPAMLIEYKEAAEEKGRIETAIIALTRDEVRAEERLADYEAFLVAEGAVPGGVLEPRNASY